jgi:hypothetical protein
MVDQQSDLAYSLGSGSGSIIHITSSEGREGFLT